MSAGVAVVMADSQIFGVAVAACTEWLDMFKCGVTGRNMLAANPTRHLPVQLTRYGLVDFVAREAQPTHAPCPARKSHLPINATPDLAPTSARITRSRILLADEGVVPLRRKRAV